MNFQITGIDELMSNLETIEKDIVRAAATTALNKTGQRLVTQIVKDVSKKAKVPQKTIRKRVKFRAKAKSNDLKTVLEIFTKPVPAIHLLTNQRIISSFGTGTNKQGVTARGRKFKSAFIQKGKYNKIHVFKRTGVFKTIPGPRGGTRKEQIDVVKINVHDFVDSAIRNNLDRVASSEFPKLFAHEIKRRTDRLRTRG